MTPADAEERKEQPDAEGIGRQLRDLDMEEFRSLVRSVGLRAHEVSVAQTKQQLFDHARRIGFPAIVRPSVIFNGAALAVVNNEEELFRFVYKISERRPVLIELAPWRGVAVAIRAECERGQIIRHSFEDEEWAVKRFRSPRIDSLPKDIFLEMESQARHFARALEMDGPIKLCFWVVGRDIFLGEARGTIVKGISANLSGEATQVLPAVQTLIDAVNQSKSRTFIEGVIFAILHGMGDREEIEAARDELNRLAAKQPEFGDVARLFSQQADELARRAAPAEPASKPEGALSKPPKWSREKHGPALPFLESRWVPYARARGLYAEDIFRRDETLYKAASSALGRRGKTLTDLVPSRPAFQGETPEQQAKIKTRRAKEAERNRARRKRLKASGTPTPG